MSIFKVKTSKKNLPSPGMPGDPRPIEFVVVHGNHEIKIEIMKSKLKS